MNVGRIFYRQTPTWIGFQNFRYCHVQTKEITSNSREIDMREFKSFTKKLEDRKYEKALKTHINNSKNEEHKKDYYCYLFEHLQKAKEISQQNQSEINILFKNRIETKYLVKGIGQMLKKGKTEEAINFMYFLKSNNLKLPSNEIDFYNKFIVFLCKKKLFKQAEKLVQLTNDLKIQNDVFTFYPLIESYCNELKLKEAFDILQIMENNSIYPTKEIYNSFIFTALQLKEENFAFYLLSTMRLDNIKLDESTFLLFIESKIQNNQLTDAIKYFDFCKDQIPISIKSFFVMMNAISNNNENHHFTEKLFEYYNDMKSFSLIPNDKIYFILIDFINNNLNRKYSHLLVSIYDDMHHNDIYLSSDVYLQSLRALANHSFGTTANLLRSRLKKLNSDKINLNALGIGE